MIEEGTIKKYFPDMPESYLLKNEDCYLINEVLNNLNEHFGEKWGNFTNLYVKNSIGDRLIKSKKEKIKVKEIESYGVILKFHMRIFDKDFDNKKVFGVGGVFKTEFGTTEDVLDVFTALRSYCSEDVCLGFGMAGEDLAKHYVENVLGGHYVDYNNSHKLYYVEFNGYQATETDIKSMQSFELF